MCNRLLDGGKGRHVITSITLPDTLTEFKIGTDDKIFGFLPELQSITYPKSFKTLPPKSGITGDNKLAVVNWPKDLEVINAQFDLPEITELVIPDGVKVIGREAFAKCGKLTSLTIPDSVEVIGNEAFYYCTELTTVRIPAHPIAYASINNRSGKIEERNVDFNNAFGRCSKLSLAVRKAITDTGYTGKFTN